MNKEFIVLKGDKEVKGCLISAADLPSAKKVAQGWSDSTVKVEEVVRDANGKILNKVSR